MKLQYFKAEPGNFGDDLNAWLWPRLFGGLKDDGRSLIGIGSILDARYSTLPGKKIVFGSGARSGSTVPKLDASWDIRFVRGPLTAAALGLNASAAITDGAVALTLLKLERVGSTNAIGFMPHYRTVAAADWGGICGRAGVRFIDPTRPVADVLRAIGGVDRLITEALHGAIVADLLRVPWMRVQCHGMFFEGPEVSEFKWADWGASLGVEAPAEAFPAIPLAPRSRLKRVILHPLRALTSAGLAPVLIRLKDSSRFRLSKPSVLDWAAGRIAEQVAHLRD